MSVHDPRNAVASGSDALLSRAAAAPARGAARLATAMADLALAEEGRLDDRTRAALSTAIDAAVACVESVLMAGTVRRLAAAGAGDVAQTVLHEDPMTGRRLIAAGLLHRADLVEEWLCRCRLDLLAGALPDGAKSGDGRPSLLVRLAEVADRSVADAAHALLVVDSQRSGSVSCPAAVVVGLPAELHHDLVWWIAAALDERFGAATAMFARALAPAAQDVIASYDEGARPAAVAMRLALAIDARAEELPELLVEAIDDRRLTLFVAVLARAAGLDFADVRAMVLDTMSAPLWLLLKAQGLDRDATARIGLALSEADPARDPDRLADDLDALETVSADAAARLLAGLSLPRDFRAARQALRASEGR